MAELTLFLTILLTLATLLPFWPSTHWLSKVWEFPRAQIAILTLVNLVMCLFVVPSVAVNIMIGINIAILAYQSFWIAPYTALFPTEVKRVDSALSQNTAELKVMTANVLMSNRSADKLINLVQEYQPDILVTLESNKWWEKALSALHETYPYRVNQALENLYGMHVFSKFEMVDVEVLNLIQDDIPSIHCYLKIRDDLRVKAHFLHPAPPSPSENTFSKKRDKELLLIARKVDPKKEPTFVAGDLNDVAWSPTTRAFRKQSKLLDPRIGRGFFNTFHADYVFARWPLDHIFHSEHFAVKTIKRLPSIDSDHFPFFTHLVYTAQHSR